MSIGCHRRLLAILKLTNLSTHTTRCFSKSPFPGFYLLIEIQFGSGRVSYRLGRQFGIMGSVVPKTTNCRYPSLDRAIGIDENPPGAHCLREAASRRRYH